MDCELVPWWATMMALSEGDQATYQPGEMQSTGWGGSVFAVQGRRAWEGQKGRLTWNELIFPSARDGNDGRSSGDTRVDGPRRAVRQTASSMSGEQRKRGWAKVSHRSASDQVAPRVAICQLTE